MSDLQNRPPVTPPPTAITVHATVAWPKDEAPPKSPGFAAIAKDVAEFIKGVSWPLLALIFCIIFRDSVRKTIEVIPDKLIASTKGSVGTLLSWEITEQARDKGGAELAERVGNLSPLAIEELITTPRDGTMRLPSTFTDRATPTFSFPKKGNLDALMELEGAGLLKFNEPLRGYWTFIQSAFEIDVTTHGDRDAYVAKRALMPQELERVTSESYGLTPKGNDALEAILTAVREQLKDAKKPAGASS